eukprot:g2357.t1
MCKGKFVIHDMRVFILSVLSTIGWLTFTVGFAVLINNNPAYFGSIDKPEFNAFTAVHFIFAIAGPLVEGVCFAYSLMAGKKRWCGPSIILLLAVLLVVAGGVVNDYGRIAYSASVINSKVPGTLVDIPDSAKAAMGGCLVCILFDLGKLMALYSPSGSDSTRLEYATKV